MMQTRFDPEEREWLTTLDWIIGELYSGAPWMAMQRDRPEINDAITRLQEAIGDDIAQGKGDENLIDSLLGVLGYAAQALTLHPDDVSKIVRYMRSERLRIHRKAYP